MKWSEAVSALQEGRIPKATRKVIISMIEPFARAEEEREKAQKAAGHNPNNPTCECAWCWQECEGRR